MKQVRLPFKFWILFGIALLLNGCGYHLVGTGSSLLPIVLRNRKFTGD